MLCLHENCWKFSKNYFICRLKVSKEMQWVSSDEFFTASVWSEDATFKFFRQSAAECVLIDYLSVVEF